MLDAGRVVEEGVWFFSKEGEKNVRFKEALDYIKKELNLKKGLSEGAERNIKKWMTELNLGKQVIFVKTNQKQITFTEPSNPTSSSGKSLRQIEPPKLIEEVYLNQDGKLEKGVGAPLVVFDSVFTLNKKGFSVDVPLNKLIMHLRFNNRGKNLTEQEAYDKADKIKGEVIKEMAEKHNMYPMGGQGDKGRINFIKFHPKGRENVNKNYLGILKELRTVDKNSTKFLKKDMEQMKKMGISNEQFKKMVVSNMMYDLNLNGFDFTPENIKTVIGKGFIPNAIAYNKRAQIWMTNGYGGNKEYIKSQIDDLSAEGNYNYVLIGDPEKPKNLSSLKALNVQLPEHVDGAILVRNDVVNAINVDAAHPKSGQNKSFIIDNTAHNGKNMGALLGKYMMHAVGDKPSAEMKKKGIHFMIMTSAAKQTGLRKVGDYEVGNNNALTLKGTETYQLNPESVKYNSSVINDSHMIQKQIYVKQLFTNLQEYGHSPIPNKMIENIHQETIQLSLIHI